MGAAVTSGGPPARILCYGDSNTWGYSPRDGSRFPPGVRWPGVLGRCLGPGFTVLEEGLNGRTLRSLGPPGYPGSGGGHLLRTLAALVPLQGLVLFLGINDLFAFETVSAGELGREMDLLLERVTSEGTPGCLEPREVVVMPPVPLNEAVGEPSLYGGQLEQSRQLAVEFRQAAARRGCRFFDPGQVIAASPLDGVHLEAEAHIRLGEALCAFLQGPGRSAG